MELNLIAEVGACARTPALAGIRANAPSQHTPVGFVRPNPSASLTPDSFYRTQTRCVICVSVKWL